MSKKTIRTLKELSKHQFISHDEINSLKEVVNNFSVAITEEMHQLIDRNNEHDPIAKQFVPSIDELNISNFEITDPIGDEKNQVVKGIVHRYPDRCLFTPVHVCPVYCRFCFRKEKIGSGAQTLNPDEIDAAFSYINQHTEIWEVIFTGGDPLILKPSILKNYLERLNAIHHVEVIRMHTRIPVVDSKRINSELIAALKFSKKPIYIILHANHPKEFTAASETACATLIDAGIPMLSQSILLKNINDHIDTLSQLMRCFIKNRIKPYYLHHADLVKGTQHFRTSIEHGQSLMKQLRGRFSGLCQPTYVLDIPGGFGKVPVGPQYLHASPQCEKHYEVEDYLATKHVYPMHEFE